MLPLAQRAAASDGRPRAIIRYADATPGRFSTVDSVNELSIVPLDEAESEGVAILATTLGPAPWYRPYWNLEIDNPWWWAVGLGTAAVVGLGGWLLFRKRR
jgi:LPXTG-motif cell wall-anchored protein